MEHVCVWEESRRRSYAYYTCNKSFEVPISSVFKKNLNACKPFEHPPSGEKITVGQVLCRNSACDT